MKCIKRFLKKLDIFGSPINFKYKSQDRYSTSFGGLFLLIFSLISIIFGIYYFIPFFKRKNMSIIYYTMNIPKTEKIRLKDSKAAFSIGFDCDDDTDIKVDDILKLDLKHVIYIKNNKGKYDKNKTPIPSHSCTKEDFYNNYDTSFEYLNLNQYLCLDDYNHNIEGIYSDQVFSYYEFSVVAKNKTSLIDEYFKKNDCKLQFYYTDITIDLRNYEDPIDPFLNSIFIQLNPTLFIKRNIYFMNQYLYDDDEMLAIFDEEKKPDQIKTLFSRYEEYSIYSGLEREKTKPLNPNDYAKIYIRADTKKTEIKRTYQKLTEFYADASSLLIAVYDFCILIISALNNFYAEQSIIKKIFLFKDIDNKNFNISKQTEKIKKLFPKKRSIKNFKTENFEIDINDIQFNTNSENLKNIKNIQPSKDLISNGSLNKKLNMKKFNITHNDKDNKKSLIIFTNENIDNSNAEATKRLFKTTYNIFNLKKTKTYIDKGNGAKLDKKEMKRESKNIKNKKKQDKFSFNVLEIIISLIFSNCLNGHLKLKNSLSDKANVFLYNKLDIILFIRNMILLDIINNILLDDKEKDIVNFISRPIIPSNNEDFGKQDIFYIKYKNNDFDKFYDSFSGLIEKGDKNKKEKILIGLTNEKLKELI